MSAPESAPTSRIYRYPRRARWSWAGALLVSLVVVAGAIALQLSPRVDLMARGQLLIFVAVFAGLARHAYDALRVVVRAVELRTDGVMSDGELVPWARVQRVDIQPLARRMDVFDDNGRRVLRLRPELEAFAGVQAYIIDRMTPRVPDAPTAVPLLSPATGSVPLLAFALIAVWFGPRQSGLPALLFLAMALLLVLLYAARRRTLRLEGDRLVLRQGWRSVDVPYDEITDVRTVAVAHGARVSAVALERGGEAPVVLAGFRGGYRAAAATIERAWRRGRQV